MGRQLGIMESKLGLPYYNVKIVPLTSKMGKDAAVQRAGGGGGLLLNIL